MSQGRSRKEADQAALQQYTLQGVHETGAELGRGSYAAVYTVEYKGLTCAAKNFHPTLYQQEYSVRRFQEECAILSRLRHPNIVQFLGIYYQPGSMLPSLVMECLPLTLAQCLDQYGVLPNEISYSILKDVALALSYLHQHNPPIIHRDLSANNVLLAPGMTAKISDLGVAKMLDLSPMQMSTMTNGPGTPCYMPPEALEEHAHYNCKVDTFSYGALMVHLFSGQWPFPTKAVKVDPQDDSRMIPQSEADRRQEKLDAIGRDHPLMSLILCCLHNSPARRPEVVEILKQASQVAANSSKNKIELLQQATVLRADTEKLQQANWSLKADTEKLQRANKSLQADAESLQQAKRSLQEAHQTEIRSLRESSSAELESTRQTLQADIRSAQTQQREAEKAVEESQRKLEDAEHCHSVEVEQLKLRLADTRDTLSSRVGEVEAELRAAQQAVSSKNSALSDRDNEVAKLIRQMAELRQEMVDQLTDKKKAFDENLQAKDELINEIRIESDQQLHGKEVVFKQKLLAKDQLLVEKQKEFDHQLLERQKKHDQSLLAKDQLLLEKQKAFEHHLIKTQNELDKQLLANEKKCKQKLHAKDKQLAEKDEKQRELDQSLLDKEQLLLEKDQLLLEKDQQLQKLREKEAEFGAILQSKEATLSLKASLIVLKDGLINSLQEQMDHLRDSHTTQIISQEKEKEIKTLETQVESLKKQWSNAEAKLKDILRMKVAAIGALIEQVNDLTAYLPKAPNPFPRGAKLKWKNCEDVPFGIVCAKVVVIEETVYVSRGYTWGKDACLIHEYSPSLETWSNLPPAPVFWFGMGELNGGLVIVGGVTKEFIFTGNVYTIDKSSQKWNKSIPPMPTARRSVSIFSQPSCLTVIGGIAQYDTCFFDVEVFLPQTSQWHKALPAPLPLSLTTMTVIQNKCFLAEYESGKIYQLCVSVHHERNGSSITPKVITKWNSLPDLSYRRFALGSINNCLLAVGGERDNPITTVQCYTPSSKSWKRVGDLPEQRQNCISVLLPTGELMVMGGWKGQYAGSYVRKVLKVTLT